MLIEKFLIYSFIYIKNIYLFLLLNYAVLPHRPMTMIKQNIPYSPNHKNKHRPNISYNNLDFFFYYFTSYGFIILASIKSFNFYNITYNNIGIFLDWFFYFPNITLFCISTKSSIFNIGKRGISKHLRFITKNYSNLLIKSYCALFPND